MLLREITFWEVLLRILMAVLLGGIIGVERGINNHSAGLRTYMLVCFGSCLIMMTNQFVYQAIDGGDPVRMGAQVVSGIGFLGAGTIMVTRNNQIKGLTTAAGLWAAAGVGLAVGIGFYEAAIIGGLTIFTILTLLHRWDKKMMQQSKAMTVYVEIEKSLAISDFLYELRRLKIGFSDMQMEQDVESNRDVRAFILNLKAYQRVYHSSVLEDIRKLKGVIYIEEL